MEDTTNQERSAAMLEEVARTAQTTLEESDPEESLNQEPQQEERPTKRQRLAEKLKRRDRHGLGEA